MKNIFEKFRFRKNNVVIEESIELGTENGNDKQFFGSDGIFTATADDSEVAGLNVVPLGSHTVVITGVTNDTDDFVTLPAIAKVPIGFQIKVLNNSGGACELRTPASSNTKINGTDADGSQELLLGDAEVSVLTKVSDSDGWYAYQILASGVVDATGTTPD